MGSDLYELLGAREYDDAEALKKAYRKKAKELHPDATGGDAAKTERFKEVGTAYAILSDPKLREEYDRQRTKERQEGVTGEATIFGVKLDDIINRVDTEGISSRNIRDIMDDLLGAARDFREKTDVRIKKAAAEGPESLIETIGDIFGIDVNDPLPTEAKKQKK
jgi:DnaJ-class molecular chaperone